MPFNRYSLSHSLERGLRNSTKVNGDSTKQATISASLASGRTIGLTTWDEPTDTSGYFNAATCINCDWKCCGAVLNVIAEHPGFWKPPYHGQGVRKE